MCLPARTCSQDCSENEVVDEGHVLGSARKVIKLFQKFTGWPMGKSQLRGGLNGGPCAGLCS